MWNPRRKFTTEWHSNICRGCCFPFLGVTGLYTPITHLHRWLVEPYQGCGTIYQWHIRKFINLSCVQKFLSYQIFHFPFSLFFILFNPVLRFENIILNVSYCFPFSVYSLIYVDHKGWYSFVLGIAYGFLLMFGFIMMTPQLFINYKLKSVAHLPWRMLTYKVCCCIILGWKIC